MEGLYNAIQLLNESNEMSNKVLGLASIGQCLFVAQNSGQLLATRKGKKSLMIFGLIISLYRVSLKRKPNYIC